MTIWADDNGIIEGGKLGRLWVWKLRRVRVFFHFCFIAFFNHGINGFINSAGD